MVEKQHHSQKYAKIVKQIEEIEIQDGQSIKI